ncbi:hypothetical protein [Kocuria carniphila]|uniref:hypothetical protein n=2 Tax=Kocuria TaxID=57493 RepID=UPI00264D43F8|nr:hypothetical protein [Kocuria carniphila]MDN5700160.1 hypothetical protein [Kocuria sp.]
MRSVRAAPAEGSQAEEMAAAEVLAAKLDRPMGILGVIFLFVVLGQLLVQDPGWTRTLNVVGWVFWVIFVAEFLLRAYIAEFQAAFWKRNWWQVIFLLIPFLRFFRALQTLRLLRLTRVARVGGIVSASVRGSRSAGKLLSNRIGWVAAVTAVVVLASSQLLYAVGSHTDYSKALYEAALTTITGSGLTTSDGFSQILHVLLAMYSVAVFATLAGSLGAYFLRDHSVEQASKDATPSSGPVEEQ